MLRSFALAGLALLGLAAGCWCPCEVHGTTMPLPQQQCSEPAARGGEVGPASQPSGGARPAEPGPASQPSPRR